MNLPLLPTTVASCPTHKFLNGRCPCGLTCVASVTGDSETTYYTEIQSALAQAEGKTVKLLKPVSGAVTIDKALTLDLNDRISRA